MSWKPGTIMAIQVMATNSNGLVPKYVKISKSYSSNIHEVSFEDSPYTATSWDITNGINDEVISDIFVTMQTAMSRPHRFDVSTIKPISIECKYVPNPSDITFTNELRKFALSKLSTEEKELLDLVKYDVLVKTSL